MRTFQTKLSTSTFFATMSFTVGACPSAVFNSSEIPLDFWEYKSKLAFKLHHLVGL